MRAAVVHQAGRPPSYDEFPDPVPQPGEVLISVAASALSQLARARAAGTHYSTHGRYPFVAGVDGVGTTADGHRVYFALPRAPHGAMAERTVVPAAQVLPLPDDLDDVAAAAIANPGMSSWAALTERACLERGQTVLVNGATGASGRLAVQIARHLGAGKVVATGRDVRTLSSLESLGADVVIPLDGDDETLSACFDQQFAAGVDVVLDYLWGRSAEQILVAAAKAGRGTGPIRFVQVGTASELDITLPGALLRSSSITLLGSGIGSVPLERLLAAVAGVLELAGSGGLDVAAVAVPLADVATAWSRGGGRTVFTTG